jgi:hypothetical protein
MSQPGPLPLANIALPPGLDVSQEAPPLENLGAAEFAALIFSQPPTTSHKTNEYALHNLNVEVLCVVTSGPENSSPSRLVLWL